MIPTMCKNARQGGTKRCANGCDAKRAPGSRFCSWCVNKIVKAMHSSGYLTQIPGSNDRNN